ncbi:MAG: hypothetical protein SWX82_14815 [Cyanobacteriota bacterium]|nr:hypothetical protein [Cyanobacteriota bacterium]
MGRVGSVGSVGSVRSVGSVGSVGRKRHLSNKNLLHSFSCVSLVVRFNPG